MSDATTAAPAAEQHRSGSVAVNGVRLHYEERGTGHPILCVHGTGSSTRLWRPALPALGRCGRAIVYDRRGYGSSERADPLPPMAVARHTDDAAALLEALDATPAVVIGRSYGGQVAIDLALRYPERVRAIALLEGVPEYLDPEAGRWLEELAAKTVAAEGGEPGAVAGALFESVMGAEGWTALPDDARGVFVGNEPAILADLKGQLALDVGAAELGKIDKPTLLVTAADSPTAFRRANERAAAAMPQARTAIVEGSHMIDPAAPPVLAFLAEVLG